MSVTQRAAVIRSLQIGWFVRGLAALLVALTASSQPTVAAADSGLSGSLPREGGISIVVWSGGPITRLPAVAAQSGCGALSGWTIAPGSSELIGYVFAAPAVVNQQFGRVFRNSALPAGAIVIVVCQPTPPAAVTDLLPSNVVFEPTSGVPATDRDLVGIGLLSMERYLRTTTGAGLLRPNAVRLRNTADGIPATGGNSTSTVCCYAQTSSLSGGGMLTIHTAHPEWTSSGTFPGTTSYQSKAHVAAHEYVHLWQFEMACGSPNVPTWLMEGTADYLALSAAEASSFITGPERRAYEIKQAMRVPSTITLQSMESSAGFSSAAIWGGYGLASEAIGQLIGKRDPSLIRDFCADVASGTAWPRAMELVFGIKHDAFYTSFESYRTTMRAP